MATNTASPNYPSQACLSADREGIYNPSSSKYTFINILLTDSASTAQQKVFNRVKFLFADLAQEICNRNTPPHQIGCAFFATFFAQARPTGSSGRAKKVKAYFSTSKERREINRDIAMEYVSDDPKNK